MKKIIALSVVLFSLNVCAQTDTSRNAGKNNVKDSTAAPVDSVIKEPDFNVITNEDIKLKIFPNPASGNTTLQIRLRAPEFLTIDLADINDNVVKIISSQKFNGADQSVFIDTNGLATGTYLLRVHPEGGSVIASTLLKIQR